MVDSLLASRFFGGHYDSVKQAAILQKASVGSSIFDENIAASKIMQEMYTARMRLDILLNGKIVVTDAQYYDGAFFQALFHTDFFPILSNLQEEYRIFEVKRRGSGLIGMIRKPFIFSALLDDKIKSQVKQTVNEELSKGTQIDTLEKARKVYVDCMDETIRPKCQEIFENMVQMDMETPTWVFDPWITGTLNENRNDALRSIRFKFPVGEVEGADPIIQFMREDLYQGRWDRSGVWEVVNNYLNLESVKQNNKADDPVTQTWAWYLKVYNRVLALQHGCIAQDLGENMIYGTTNTQADDQERKEMLKSISKNIIHKLPQNLIHEIAQENWSDFADRLNKEPLLGIWKNYMRTRMEVIGLPDGPHKTLRLFGPLDELVGYLRAEYGSTDDYATYKIKKKAIRLTAETLLLAGGALTSIATAAGLIIGSVVLLIGGEELIKMAIGNPLEYLNMVKMGLESTREGD